MTVGTRQISDKLLAKYRAWDTVSEAEARALDSVFTRQASYPRGAAIIRAGEELDGSTLLLSGFANRYKDLSDGRRQSLELSVPGDFIDLHSFTLKRIDHDIGALSAVRTAWAPHERIREITAELPHLTRLLWLNTTVDAALHRERIMSLGARTAAERLAAFVWETRERLRVVGLADETGYDLPLTQADLAELLGLSMVHMNRTIRELRERGLAVLRDRMVRIEDWDGLRKFAQFHPGYLHQRTEPR